MATTKDRRTTIGFTIHVVVGAVMIVSGVAKILALVPKAPIERLGLADQIQMIGAGEVITAVLLLVPRVSSFGIWVASAYWGGAICIHMAHGDTYIVESAFLILSWWGAYLRNRSSLHAPVSAAEP